MSRAIFQKSPYFSGCFCGFMLVLITSSEFMFVYVISFRILIGNKQDLLPINKNMQKRSHLFFRHNAPSGFFIPTDNVFSVHSKARLAFGGLAGAGLGYSAFTLWALCFSQFSKYFLAICTFRTIKMFSAFFCSAALVKLNDPVITTCPSIIIILLWAMACLLSK